MIVGSGNDRVSRCLYSHHCRWRTSSRLKTSFFCVPSHLTYKSAILSSRFQNHGRVAFCFQHLYYAKELDLAATIITIGDAWSIISRSILCWNLYKCNLEKQLCCNIFDGYAAAKSLHFEHINHPSLEDYNSTHQP